MLRWGRVRLREGVVVTIEPGMYLEGDGGVRIEDDVLVTKSGRTRLTTLPRDQEQMIVQRIVVQTDRSGWTETWGRNGSAI